MSKRVFLSDIHMGAGWSLDNVNGQYDWLDRGEVANLKSFLDSIASDDSIEEVILLGDILDSWVYPIDIVPPKFETILDSSYLNEALGALNGLAQNKKVTYVYGNHDMHLKDNQYDKLRDEYFKDISFGEYYETKDGIWADHGHEYAMWNATDHTNNFPVGYFYSRLAATVEAWKNVKCSYNSVMETLLSPSSHASGHQLINLPFSYLANQLNIGNSAQIKMDNEESVALSEVRNKYKELDKNWNASHGPIASIESIALQLSGLESIARQIAIDRNKRVVVFGHTHTRMLTYLNTPAEIPYENHTEEPFAIYANCGTWCRWNKKPWKRKPYTYVVTEYDSKEDSHTVSLKYWGGKLEEKLTI